MVVEHRVQLHGSSRVSSRVQSFEKHFEESKPIVFAFVALKYTVRGELHRSKSVTSSRMVLRNAYVQSSMFSSRD